MGDAAGPVSYQPTEGLCYDPSDPRYWDENGLKAEVTRTFEICHGCRLCFKYCDAFPRLFELIDKSYDGDVLGLTENDTQGVMDDCFQCKLCEVQCPYTVRDKHEYQLDFPKLVHRYKAQRARKRGLSLSDKVLSQPDRAGSMARASFGLANVMNRVGLHRWFMEKVLGVDRRKLLPDFAARTFESWAKSKGLTAKPPGGEAVLFQTCFVQNNEPDIGQDTVAVFQRNQVDLRCVEGLQCCGMPAWERGDLESVRKQAHANLDLLLPYVEKGARVIAINPTCSMMMRRDYPELLEGSDRQRAEKLAEAVMDPSEYLWSLRDQERFNTDFRSSPGESVAYHAPCHLRAQGVGFKGRDLLRMIPGVKPTTTMECCGHDGTFAMTTHGFEPSKRIGQRAFDGVQDGSAEVWSTDCPLAAIQFAQHAGRKPMHPMSILARAYEENGFPRPVKDTNDQE
jgi:Fe-S oxidoreductase